MQGTDTQDVPIIVVVEDVFIHTEASPFCSNGMYKCHDWQPTIIIGYYQCRRCDMLAACTACVSNVRGRAIAGTCFAHLDLTPSQAWQEEEVLG